MGLELWGRMGKTGEHRAFSALSDWTENYIQIKVQKIRGGAIKRICQLSGQYWSCGLLIQPASL